MKGTPLHRNSVVCASWVSGLCKDTEHVSIVTKSTPSLSSAVLSDIGTIVHRPHVDHELANLKFFIYLTATRVNVQAIVFHFKTEHCSCKSLFWWRQQNVVITTSLKEVCILYVYADGFGLCRWLKSSGKMNSKAYMWWVLKVVLACTKSWKQE